MFNSIAKKPLPFIEHNEPWAFCAALTPKREKLKLKTAAEKYKSIHMAKLVRDILIVREGEPLENGEIILHPKWIDHYSDNSSFNVDIAMRRLGMMIPDMEFARGNMIIYTNPRPELGEEGYAPELVQTCIDDYNRAVARVKEEYARLGKELKICMKS